MMTPSVKDILARRAAGRLSDWVFVGKKPGEHLSKLNGQHDAVVEKIGAEFVLYEIPAHLRDAVRRGRRRSHRPQRFSATRTSRPL